MIRFRCCWKSLMMLDSNFLALTIKVLLFDFQTMHFCMLKSRLHLMKMLWNWRGLLEGYGLNTVGHLLIHNHVAQCHPALTTELEYLDHFELELPEGVLLKGLLRMLQRNCLQCIRHPSLVRTPHNIVHLATHARQILMRDFLYVNSTGYILTLQDCATRKLLLLRSSALIAWANLSRALGAIDIAKAELKLTGSTGFFTPAIQRR